LRLYQVHALKVITPELAEDLAFCSRFERESRVAAQIEHPNVIAIHYAGDEDGRLYLAMKFIEGTDLRAELVRCGRFEPERAVEIVSQVASALDAAHACGLVHRDVKPASVLLSARDGGDYAYLTDFGLTKHLESRGRETRTGMFVGTTDYIAPEQVSGGELDRRADVYSLGCVLYELLPGRVPYPRDNEIATATAHLNEPRHRCLSFAPNWPHALTPSSAPRWRKCPPSAMPVPVSSHMQRRPPLGRPLRAQADHPVTATRPKPS
jgi:serine/threonine protein kinase